MANPVGGFIDTVKETFGADDPFGDVAAAEAQQEAQRLALEQQAALAQQAQQTFLQQSQLGIDYIGQGVQQGAELLTGYGGAAEAYIGQGQRNAAGAYDAGRLDSLDALRGGYQTSRGDLAAGYVQARGDLGQLAGLQRYGASVAQGINSYDALSRRQDRLGGMLDQPGGLYGGFENDPGYQYRRQAGEDAIMRAASAQGGRHSGATMKALAEYNQNLASQEYGNFAARRQAEAGVAGGSDAAYAGLLQGQAGRSDAASLAAQQYQYGLAGMGYGAQGQLAALAAQQGQQNAGYASQYGTQQAGIQSAYGQTMGDMYGQNASQIAGIQAGIGSQLGNMYANAGSNMGNVAIGVGGNAQQNANSMANAYQNYAQYGGMTQQAQANSNRETAAMIAAFASDERLKCDIETVPGSKFEAIGLRGVKWTWNECAAAHFGLTGESGGVIAQEAREKYPHAVYQRDGFLTVDYAELDRLIAEAA